MTSIPQNPAVIAQGSFAIIQRELAEAGHTFEPNTGAVVERIIHSTADFEFADITRFSPGAIEAGVAALQSGCAVVTDVNMIRVGVSSTRLAHFGGAVHCFVADPQARQFLMEQLEEFFFGADAQMPEGWTPEGTPGAGGKGGGPSQK